MAVSVYAAAVAVVAATLSVVGPSPAGPSAEDPVTVFQSGTAGYHTFRIPAVVRTRGGALLAFAEGRRGGAGDAGDIDLVLRRSTDGGRTWGPLRTVGDNGPNTFGNPAPVVDPRTGRVVLLSTHNAGTATEQQILRGEVPPEASRRVFVQHSDDDGVSWSAPAEVTATAKRADWRWYATGPGHAIALRRGPHAGRLVVPANHSAAPPAGSSDTGAEPKYYGAHLLISDDGGATWRIGAEDSTPDGWVNANESTVAQLPDGRLYVNTRDQNGAAEGSRAATYSHDGGDSYEAPFAPRPDIVGPVVQGSTLQVDGGPLLLSLPGDPGARRDLTVRASADGGRTWPRTILVAEGPAAYSDLVALNGRTVGLLYENGQAGPYEAITFRRFPGR